jgi:hypothetical protein
LTWILVLPETARAQSAAESTNGLRLSVQVYNWAKVSRETLQKGQALVGEIFKEAGVTLEWVECPCETQTALTTLTVRIVPRLFGSTTSSFRSDHIGFAAATEEGGVLASVFYDRIESAGKGGDLSGVLGLATAHELGHLLLGSKAHSDDGIMQSRWTRKQLRQTDPTLFSFTLQQSATIRERITQYQALMNSRR